MGSEMCIRDSSSDVDALRSELETTLNKNESVGRLIAGQRASGKLTQV